MREGSTSIRAISTTAKSPGSRSASAPRTRRSRLSATSRILFDTDLDRFEALTGIRPVQLAIHGTSALTLLGRCGEQPELPRAPDRRSSRHDVLPAVRRLRRICTPAGRLHVAVRLASASRSTTCCSGGSRSSIPIIGSASLRIGWILTSVRVSKARRTTSGKSPEVGENRATWMWPRIENDPFWRDRTRWAWKGFKEKFQFTPELIAKGHARAKAAVAKIRARGGEVVFVRPPSAPQLRVNEEAQVPKAKGWDVLLRNTDSVGVHVDDLASGAGIDAARVVTPQPKVCDRIHRRLCPTAGRAYAAVENKG